MKPQNGGEVVVFPQDVLLGLCLQTLFCSVYLESQLSVLHAQELRALVPHLIQLRI